MKDKANKLTRLDWARLARNFDKTLVYVLKSKTLTYQEIEDQFYELIDPFVKNSVCKEDLDNLKANVVIRIFHAVAFGKENFALDVVENAFNKTMSCASLESTERGLYTMLFAEACLRRGEGQAAVVELEKILAVLKSEYGNKRSQKIKYSIDEIEKKLEKIRNA